MTTEIEQELRRQLAESKREMEQFAYIVSHDLQAPLRTQMSFVQLFRMEYADSLEGDALDYLRFIDDSAKTMQGLIQGLLAYSRAGRIEVGHDPVPLNEVLQNAKVALRELIESSGAQIESDPLPTIQGNRDALTTVLTHLLRNALQYTREGVAPAIRISADTEADTLALRFADNGIGVEPDLAEAAFEIFRRVHTVRNLPEGSGMGLPVSRRIAATHGGSLVIEPQEPPGACVRLTLPLRQPE